MPYGTKWAAIGGFTGHEMLDEFGLINMNGRMYDPVIARVLSPDILVQNPTFTQCFNRYSYCFNNPLLFVDPSGYLVSSVQRLRMESYLRRYGYSQAEIWQMENDPEYADIFVTGGGGMGPGSEFYSSFGNLSKYSASQVKAASNGDRYVMVQSASSEYNAESTNGVGWVVVNKRVNLVSKYLQRGDYLRNANKVLNGAGYLAGGLGVIQIGMLDYRQTLPLMNKIGTFSRFSSSYRILGTTSKVLGGAANWVGAPLATYLDYNAMQNGEISGTRFTYRTTGTVSSIGGGAAIGWAFGGPYGVAGGALIGVGFVASEYIYDGAVNIWNLTINQISNFENALKSGWYPGR